MDMLLVLLCVILCACASISAESCADGSGRHRHRVNGYLIYGTCPPPTLTTEAPTDPVVHSESGTFKGSWMTSRRGRPFQAFRSIRYAEPPVGKLRFKPPVMKLTYDGVVDASEEGPACPQVAPPSYYIDEDCLTVNVYTPHDMKNSSKPLPVIVYIHAGGFYSMSGRSDLVGPNYLMDRDIVFVSINYRLGSLGWLTTGDKYAPGNNGMKDQVAALRWVQRNIAAFGGDPGLVTIAGCSAGGNSIMLHMISPMSKGLFHRGISISGTPGKGPLESHQRHLAVKQAQLLDCPTHSSEAIINCLTDKPFREFSNYSKFFEFGPYDPVALWNPVVEQDYGQERFLSVQPEEAIKQGNMHEVPYIITQTTDELYWLAFIIFQNASLVDNMNKDWERIAPISFMLPSENASVAARKLREVYLHNHRLQNDSQSLTGLQGLYRDSVTGYGVHKLANTMCRYSREPVYYSEFAYIGNNSYYQDPVDGKPKGAAHHDDTLYLFRQSYMFPNIDVSSPDSHVVDEMTALWYNFARYGDPNPRGDTPELGSLHWPVMKPDDRKFLYRGDQLLIKQNMLEDRYKVWEELYPLQ